MKLSHISVAAAVGVTLSGVVLAQSTSEGVLPATFAEDGSVSAPTDYRLWVYVGTPFTPNILNDGEAPFPEFHNVYVEPSAFEHFARTV
jgi:hypothetical protein